MNEAAAYGGIMTGGAIQNNTGHRGAAVNIYSDDRDKRAIFTLEDDGLITRNTGISANGNEAGGAVFVEDNAAFHMIGGTVSANKASKGGGICIVDSALQRGTAEYGTEFLMDGGVISGNRAGTGGGIYSFSNGSFLRSGKIINNNNIFWRRTVFRGKSIDGYSTAHLYNTVVTENTAEQGGGLWFCATGMAELYIKDGIGIFDNKAVNADGKAAGDDLVFSIYGEHSAYTATLAERMLGGGAVKWYRDGTVYNPTPTGYTQIGPGSQRYEEGSGAVPLSSDEEAGSADIEERKDEEMAIQTLPKTGRSKDYTMFAWLFSGLILLAMVILKRKVK